MVLKDSGNIQTTNIKKNIYINILEEKKKRGYLVEHVHRSNSSKTSESVCVCVCTSVHDTSRVHVLQRTTELNKVLPYRLFRDQPPLFLEML